MIDSKGAAFGFDCCLASPKVRVFQQPARPAARLHINFFSRCRKRPDPADNLSQTAQFSLPSGCQIVRSREKSPVPKCSGKPRGSPDVPAISFRNDICEFESSHPSHAVGSLWRVYPVHGLCEQRITDRRVPAFGHIRWRRCSCFESDETLLTARKDCTIFGKLPLKRDMPKSSWWNGQRRCHRQAFHSQSSAVSFLALPAFTFRRTLS